MTAQNNDSDVKCNAPEDHCEICDLDCPFEKIKQQSTRTYRVILVYRDQFDEEAGSEEEAIQRVQECFDIGHDDTLLGNKPEIFAFEIAPEETKGGES